MKKVISFMLVMVLMLSGLFVLTGCENNTDNNGATNNSSNEQKEESKNEKFEIEAKFGGKLSFEMPKDTGYELTVDTNKGTLKHNENDSTITLFLMNTSKSSIIMKEKDFSASAYTGYTETKINGLDAYFIKKSNNFAVQYGILLDEYDKDNGKYHGVKIEVSKNSLKLDEFDPAAFVETDAFKTLLNSLKFEFDSEEVAKIEEENKKMKNYGEFESRTDGMSDKKGLIFIKKYDSPNEALFKAEQRNDNIGIDNYLWYKGDSSYKDTSIEVRIFPQEGTFENIDAYKTKKGNMYTWDKTTIAGKEYDTFKFSNSSPIAKFSQDVQGAFMVGNRVVEFSYTMYKDIEDQAAGDTFFNLILNSIEYSKDFK